MKLLIKSITDVITNSSSEVFIMETEYAELIKEKYDTDAISITNITEEYLDSYKACHDAETIIEVAGLKDKLTDEEKNIFYDDDVYASEDAWLEFYHKHKKQIDHNLLGKSFIDIEDYFRDSRLAFADANECCVWHDYNY